MCGNGLPQTGNYICVPPPDCMTNVENQHQQLQQQMEAMTKVSASDAFWAPALEGGLLLVVGGVALALHRPLLFASLGPTVYEQVEKPRTRSARFYNVLVGHLAGVGAGFAALFLVGTRQAPDVLATGHLTLPRMWAVIIAVALTTLITVALHCQQPAATSTTMLIALGQFQNWHQAQTLLIAIGLVAAIGEPLRRIRTRQKALQHQAKLLAQQPSQPEQRPPLVA